jgi:hypothetical protein
MHQAKEAPPPDYLVRPGVLDESAHAEDAAFVEEALARDKALRAGGPAIEWEIFEAWVRARLSERISASPVTLLPGM